MAKDYCKASIKDSPRLGDLHCDKLAKIDNLCGQHGRMFDSGKPITWAKADAPTLNQVYACWWQRLIKERISGTCRRTHKYVSLGSSTLAHWEHSVNNGALTQTNMRSQGTTPSHTADTSVFQYHEGWAEGNRQPISGKILRHRWLRQLGS